jgi:uncharacterized protein (TIGR04222 family)
VHWLTHNTLADLDGPLFLLLYRVVIAVILFDAVSLRGRDPTKGMDPPLVPSKPDPVEVAYLRGAAPEVTRLVVFDLIRRGYLKMGGEAPRLVVGHHPLPPDTGRLTSLERAVFNHFTRGLAAADLFKSGGLSPKVEALCESLREWMIEAQLLAPPGRFQRFLRTWIPGALVIAALGGLKLTISLAKGRHNLGFLIMMAAVSLVVLALIARVPRLTARGRAFLGRLRLAFEGRRSDLAGSVSRYDPTALLVPAIFGVGVLAGTPYDGVSELFKKSAAGGSCGGGCGSGCGGGGCGGGGCSGGCGGCGGCGG